MADPHLSENTSVRTQSLLSRRRGGGGGEWGCKAQRHILDMFGMAEEANQCFLIWLAPDQFYRFSVHFIKKQSPCFFVLPEMWYWMGLTGSRYSCHHWKCFFLFCSAMKRHSGKNVCLSGTFLFTCKTTFSMVRCFWMSVRALFGPNPAILSQ